MVQKFSGDLLAVVCSHLDFKDMLNLLFTSQSLYANNIDGFFKLVAVLQWGVNFWADALSRNTSKTYSGMKNELFQISRLNARFDSSNLPRWGQSDYRVFWAVEDEMKRKKEASRLGCGARLQRVVA